MGRGNQLCDQHKLDIENDFLDKGQRVSSPAT